MSFTTKITKHQYAKLMEECSGHFDIIGKSIFKTSYNFVVNFRGEFNFQLPVIITLKATNKIAQINVKAIYTKVYIISLGSWIVFLILFGILDMLFFGIFLGAVLFCLIYLFFSKGVSRGIDNLSQSLIKKSSSIN